MIKILLFILITQCFNGCNEPNHKNIMVVDSMRINDSLNMYIYKKTDFLHEGNESIIAIGKDLCEIAKNDKLVFAKSPSFAQIDTIISNHVYLSSYFKIEFLRFPQNLKFDTIEMVPGDTFRHRLNVVVSSDCK